MTELLQILSALIALVCISGILRILFCERDENGWPKK